MMLFPILIVLSVAISTSAFSMVQMRTGLSLRSSLKMSLKEGDKVPSVVFKARVRDENLPQPNPFKWKDVRSEDLFQGKRAVLFALPGGKHLFTLYPPIKHIIMIFSTAFTPTCSSTHLPGYETLYGIDFIF